MNEENENEGMQDGDKGRDRKRPAPAKLVDSDKVKEAKEMTRLGHLALKMRGGIHPKHLVEIEKPWYLEHINDGDVVVDLGCGTGTHGDTIQEEVVAQVISFDKDYRNGEFFYTDLEWCIPLPDNIADKVLLFDVLEHIENRDSLLKNIRRILKPDGLLLLSVPNANTKAKRLRKRLGFRGIADGDHKVEYDTLIDIYNELWRNGYGIINSHLIVIDTLWAGMIDLVGGIHLGTYKRLARWKRNQVFKNPSETTGWRIVCCVQNAGRKA